MFRSMLAMTFGVLLGFSPDAFAQQNPKGKSNFFEFVGFSTTPIMPGPNVGLPGMNKVCQDDFDNPDARICTRDEYTSSTSATGLPNTPAWVHSQSEANIHHCGWWSDSGLTGTVIRRDPNFTDTVFNFMDQDCNDARPVTCCARLN